MSVLNDIRRWARRVKRDAVTLWFACRHPGTPWLPKALAAFVVAYALSPIDLIPDFIPVLGYVDDALLLPALIWLAIRMLPQEILADCRIKADEWMSRGEGKPRSAWGAALVIGIWLGAGAVLWAWLR
ncbi:YkvA family protein [Variovorax sp. M-6]|uniref:YkvA family protein n=1 Tax=Variovorax sp. M-6 TaxID=3233041 RepID=UPI003F95354C